MPDETSLPALIATLLDAQRRMLATKPLGEEPDDDAQYKYYSVKLCVFCTIARQAEDEGDYAKADEARQSVLDAKRHLSELDRRAHEAARWPHHERPAFLSSEQHET